MKHGGELIYAGPLGPKSRKLVEFFEVGYDFFSALHIFFSRVG